MPLPHQASILRPPPPQGRFVTFALAPGMDPRPALERLASAPYDARRVVGIGAPVFERLGQPLEGLRPFPTDLSLFPSSQAALWLFLAHPEASARFDSGRQLALGVKDAFAPAEEIDGFLYRGGRDLSGFEDGTENPKGQKATAAAIVRGRGAGLDGASFVAIQRWVHDLQAIERMSDDARNAVVGRNRKSNVELPDAPASAHVKRTAQESFTPESFIVRRSMSWGGVAEHGLYFVAYGESLDRFERQLRRMAGQNDGIVDGLSSFTRALTGGYYFCPPVRSGRLDLRALGV